MAALISLGAITTHAQHMGGAQGPSNGGGSGAGFGGGLTAPTQIAVLPNTPPYRGEMAYTSGSASDFVPSSWSSFDQAVLRGRAEMVATKKSVVEVAEETRTAQKTKARVTIIEDQDGKPVLKVQ